MFCHGELALLKPHPKHLTSFYLMCASGGAIGGIFVGLLAPRMFNLYLELPIGLLLCAILVFLVLTSEPSSRLYYGRWHPAFLLLLAGAVAFSWYLGGGIRDMTDETRLSVRNFYGVLQISDKETDQAGIVRNLLHGRIYHGSQLLNPSRRLEPIAYYGPKSGIGRLLQNSQSGTPRRVGVLGLGVGTLVAFGRQGDYFRIYEINPLAIILARTKFTFLSDTKARFDIVEGDARMLLEREPNQQFDILAMDAFSGDSIPVHLVTREALLVYFRHLKPLGVLAVNISNKYIDLAPVMYQAARTLDKEILLVDDHEDENDEIFYSSTWVLMSNRNVVLRQPSLIKAAVNFSPEKFKHRVWTDDYSNLWQVIKRPSFGSKGSR
jgi:SAM-dependent methyltransferase